MVGPPFVSVQRAVSIYFLALSQAPPAFPVYRASMIADIMDPISTPPTKFAPKRKPPKRGKTTAMYEGSFISCSAPSEAMLMQELTSGSSVPSKMPGFP